MSEADNNSNGIGSARRSRSAQRTEEPTQSQHMRVSLVKDPNDLSQDGDGVGYAGLSEIAQQLEDIAKVFGAYHYNATIGEHSLNLFTASSGYPLRLELEGDAVESIADSVKRIADALTTKNAG